MNEFNIESIEDRIILYFGTSENKINAYSLASSLIAFADSARKANSKINPGYNIEVYVESLEDGSFKAILKTIYKSSHNLFSTENLKAVVLGVIATSIYELAFQDGPNIIINTNEVVIEQGDKKIIVPRNVYDSTEELKNDSSYMQSVNDLISSIKNDSNIQSFGVTNIIDDPPEIEFPIEEFKQHVVARIEDREDIKVVIEESRLEILKAILERGRRKWEFVWRGIKISAPVLDDNFYDQFFRHEITIAPGDVLIAKLKIVQKQLPDVAIYTNESYEILDVLRHEPKIKQSDMGI